MADILNETMENVEGTMAAPEPETNWETDPVDEMADPSTGILTGFAKKLIRGLIVGGTVAGGCWLIDKVKKPKHIERPVKPIGDVLVGRRSAGKK